MAVAAKVLWKCYEPSFQMIEKDCHQLLAKSVISEECIVPVPCFSCLLFQLPHVNINYRKVRAKNIPVNQGVINIYMVVKAIRVVRSSVEMAVSTMYLSLIHI